MKTVIVYRETKWEQFRSLRLNSCVGDWRGTEDRNATAFCCQLDHNKSVGKQLSRRVPRPSLYFARVSRFFTYHDRFYVCNLTLFCVSPCLETVRWVQCTETVISGGGHTAHTKTAPGDSLWFPGVLLLSHPGVSDDTHARHAVTSDWGELGSGRNEQMTRLKEPRGQCPF